MSLDYIQDREEVNLFKVPYMFLFSHKTGKIVLTEKNLTVATSKAYRCPMCRNVILYRRYREQILYLFFGSMTTLLSLCLFWLFTQGLTMPALIANIIDWVVCVLFAYMTNRTWVFTEKAQDAEGIVRECAAFMVGRLVTLALEEALLWLGIEVMYLYGMAVKTVAQVLVIIANYAISKWIVFKGIPHN